MKHIVIDLETPNEHIIFSKTFGNYCFDTFFGNFSIEISPLGETDISLNQSISSKS